MRFLNAIGFLTIIKIPSRFYIKQEDYHKTVVYFPVVGMLIGLMSILLFFALNFIFPLILVCLVLAGFEIIITGAIHIDGLADTFDGVFSGETEKSKIMEIMKKGDIGVFGVIAVIFSIAFKVIFYYLIASKLFLATFIVFEQGFKFSLMRFFEAMPGFLLFASIIIFTPVFGRNIMAHLFSRYEPAVKTASLVTAFKHKDNRFDFAITFAFSSIFFIFISVLAKINISFSGKFLISGIFKQAINNISLAVPAALYAITGFFTVVLTLLFSAGIGNYFSKKTGGSSGDIIGAVCVLSEIFFLFLNYIAIIFL